jgi:putative pyruvate formate lyase activating enzyme
MPGMGAEAEAILGFIASHFSLATYINLMGQYHPCGRAEEYEELRRPIAGEEYRHALAVATRLGLTRLDHPNLSEFWRQLGV